MKQIAPIIAALALTSACTQSMEIEQAPVDVTRNAGFVTANYVGTDPTVVRSYFEKNRESGEKKTEFAGAECQIKGRGYSARFKTPAIVNLPDYDYHSQPVTGQCTLGKTLRPIVLKPYNETLRSMNEATNAQAMQGGLIGGLAAVVATSLVTAVNDPTNDDWDYDDLSVMFPSSERPTTPDTEPQS